MATLTIGVLGGMGPQATCDLFQKLIDATPARSDQEHLHVIIDSNPAIPDRTAFLLGKGPDPTPALVESACRLARAGCDFLIMPCNTAHYFVRQIEEAAGIPVLDMIEITAQAARQVLSPGDAAGLMATTGTIQSGLYHRALARHGLQLITPDEADQAEVMDIIYGPQGVKAGYRGQDLRARARAVAERLVSRGARVVIAGCTEIPLVLASGDISVPVLDSTGLLAQAAVARARSGAEAGAGQGGVGVLDGKLTPDQN